MSALLPPFRGSVSAANESVDSVCRSGCAFQPDARKPLYVDGLICYHSCCQVLQLNLTARVVTNQAIKLCFGVGLMRNNDDLESVSALLPPFLGVSERSERVWTQCVGQVAHFNLTPESLFMLMV